MITRISLKAAALVAVLLMFLGTAATFVVLALPPAGAAESATITEFPQDLQLYPRDLDTNLATIDVEGTAADSHATITLNVFENGTLIRSATHDAAASPNFAFTEQIPAALTSFDFELTATDTNGAVSTIAAASDVVAGDMLVINGQSNAVATMYNGSAAAYESPFVRSFGSSSETWTGDLNWHIADGDCSMTITCVGQWGMSMAGTLIANEGIPIAIINGARGGRAMTYFPRNDANPLDVTTNYGRLFTRVQQAGAVGNVRAVLWYQGESDNNPALPPGDATTTYISRFSTLHDNWVADFAPIEQLYVIQIRTACGANLGAGTSNVQREYARDRSAVTAISTTALNGHDGCHYAFANGYEALGLNIARIVRNDLFDADLADAEAVDITSANFLAADTIELGFAPGSDLVGDPGFEALFAVHNNLTNETVIPTAGAVAPAGNVVLTLPAPMAETNDITVSYSSPAGTQNWLTNLAGIGILSFQDVPVVAAPEGDVNCDMTPDVVDALLIAQYATGNRNAVATCPLASPLTQIFAPAADKNADSVINIVDALLIAQCSIGIANDHC